MRTTVSLKLLPSNRRRSGGFFTAAQPWQLHGIGSLMILVLSTLQLPLSDLYTGDVAQLDASFISRSIVLRQ